jgi:GT2 family glycosyltransferase
MRLLIVIVNYRTADLTIDCLRSLAPQIDALPGTHVTITDCLSPEDSVARLSAAITENGWSQWAKLVPLPKNGGFAYGNNGGIRPALESNDPPEYILLLNPDTVVRPDALAHLLAFMDAHPAVGIAGSRLEDPDGTSQRSAFRFPTVLSELEHGLRLGAVSRLLSRHVVAPPVPDVACAVDWVAGASMIIRKSVFDAIGLMDDGYFMYFEEVDFCLRARRAGLPCWYVPSSRVIHLVGQASGVTDSQRSSRRRPRYWFDSRRRYFLKNHGRIKTLLADLCWAGGFALFRVRQFIQRKPNHDPKLLLWDFVRYNLFPVRK